jgi:hypothetical protein
MTVAGLDGSPVPRARLAAESWPRVATLALVAILGLAAGLRLWGIGHDLPFSYYGDELYMMKRAMAMGTGDLDPHWFHKPGLLMYLLALCYGLYYAAGRLAGAWGSTAAFGAHFLADAGPFLLIGRLVISACGVATVYVVYRLARRVYGSLPAALAAALVAAVLVPMIGSSQEIKSDVPCAFLMTLSLYAFLGVRETASARPLAVASLLAGAAMGMHYYAAVLPPTYALFEIAGAVREGARQRTARRLGRLAIVGACFLGGFFVTSPYNFLDPSFRRAVVDDVARKLLPAKAHAAAATPATPAAAPKARDAATVYEPDTGVHYRPGARAWAGAARQFAGVFVSQYALGWTLSLLSLLGLAVVVRQPETRWYGLLVLVPVALFSLAAVTLAAYHAAPRHLNPVYPLLATLIFPGVAFVLGRLGVPRRRLAAASLGVVALACLPSAAAAAAHDLDLGRLDSRVVAYRWIVAHLPRSERVLADDYGPELQPDRRAVERQRALLPALARGPFTGSQATRLGLLARFPPPDGFDMDELGHPWWLSHEKTDAELRSSAADAEMGNPLISRQPRPLAEYRADGVRYVVTNAEARARYFAGKQANGGFPSFVRFYRELSTLPPMETFDPRAWHGKGPVVWIYDLAAAPRPCAGCGPPTSPDPSRSQPAAGAVQERGR